MGHNDNTGTLSNDSWQMSNAAVQHRACSATALRINQSINQQYFTVARLVNVNINANLYSP